MTEFSDTENSIDLFNSSKYLIPFVKAYFSHILNQPKHKQDIIENALKQASEYLNRILSDPNESIRGDWYAENDITDSNVFNTLELTINDIINSNDKPKSLYTAYFWANVIRTYNSDIDIYTAYKYFNVIGSLSYRKLCEIKLSFEYEAGLGNWNYDEIDPEYFKK